MTIGSMNKLLDKWIVFTLCMAFYIHDSHEAYMVVPVILAVTDSALNSYFDNLYFKCISFAAYTAACIFVPDLLFFMPLICYDILLLRWKWLIFFVIIPMGFNSAKISVITNILTVLLIVLVWLMKHREESLEKIKSEYISLRDTAKEFSLQLESKNKELMEKQDYEINLATLNERNRIAREIHDNVGHLLSSSILQIGAFMATCKDEAFRESLNTLKMTLSQGMDSIRNSIHDLHDESIDLYTQTRTLVGNFHFCPITLDYDIENNPNKKIQYALLSIIKEALSNIIKHSEATHVNVILREHPALYQLIIKDNGAKQAMNLDAGIGLKNITDRVNGLSGIAHISNENGFVVFVTIPKEAPYENSNCR